VSEVTPADLAYNFQRLVDRINALETQVGVMMRALGTVGQRATVQAVPGGAMINVTMAGTSTVKSVPFLGTGFYTPGVGHGGVVVPVGDSWLFVPVSAYLTI
jgi:hypothetical protein